MALSLVELGRGLHFMSVHLTPHGPPLRNVGQTVRKGCKGPFKGYVTQWGYQILLEKKHCKVVRLNVISATRG